MKSQILSFTGFIRLPWIAWALPQAIETDMDAPTLAGVLASMELDGNAHTAILDADRHRTARDGLTITHGRQGRPTWRGSSLLASCWPASTVRASSSTWRSRSLDVFVVSAVLVLELAPSEELEDDAR